MNIITEFFKIQNQLKVFHWQTESYAQHEAFGETYAALDTLIDTFIEQFMGKYGRIKTKDKFVVESQNITSSPDTIIDGYINMLTNDLPELLDEKDTNLLNIRDEMLGELNKLKYLLTLK